MLMDDNSADRCVRPKELAEMAGVRPQMIYNYIAADRIPAVRCDQHKGWCIDRDDAWDWLEAREAKAQAKYEKIQKQLRGEM